MLKYAINKKLGWQKVNDFITKECPLNYIEELVEIVEPYLKIDVALALENGQHKEAFEMVCHAIDKSNNLSEVIIHRNDVSFGIRPNDTREFCGKYLDGDRYSFGYEREWRTYEYLRDDTKIIEFSWHRHDGYGREVGEVELWVTLIDKRAIDII